MNSRPSPPLKLHVFIALLWSFFLPLEGLSQISAKASTSAEKDNSTLPEVSKEKIFVRARHMLRDTEKQQVQLKGDVQIIFQNRHLFCDEASVDLKSKSLVAKGNVTLTSLDMTIEGDRVDMNYETNHGTIYNGFIVSGKMHFDGEVIHQTGTKKFEAINGEYTACSTCPPAWSFKGKRIKATIGGYAKISQPTLKFAGFPLVWLPYLIVPLKSKRQSGLLFPNFGGSNDSGTQLGQSFFWAIDDHRDLTLSIDSFSKRGLKYTLNNRFYLDPVSYGQLDTAFIKDRVLPSSNRVTDFANENSLSRWFVKYFHYYELPGDIIQRTKINLMSDLQYLVDFPEDLDGQGLSDESNITRIGDPSLENRISLTKNGETFHSSVDIGYNINLLKTNAKTDNDDAVHRFPEIRYSLTERTIGDSNFLFQFDSHYVNFSRNSFSFDNVNLTGGDPAKEFTDVRDGEFNSNEATKDDLIRTGERFEIKPKISYPFNIGPYVNVLPSITYRDTNYQFGIGDDPTARRQSIRTTVQARATIDRVFKFVEEIPIKEENDAKGNDTSENSQNLAAKKPLNIEATRVKPSLSEAEKANPPSLSSKEPDNMNGISNSSAPPNLQDARSSIDTR